MRLFRNLNIVLLVAMSATLAYPYPAKGESSCVDTCTTSDLGTQKQAHCAVLQAIPIATNINATLLALNTAALAACTWACVDPLNPAGAILCNSLDISVAVLEIAGSITQNQILAGPLSNIRESVGDLAIATNSISDPSTGVFAGAGGARTGLQIFGNKTLRAGASFHPQTGQTFKGLGERVKTGTKLNFSKNLEASAKNTPAEKVIAKQKSLGRALFCGSAALHAVLVGIRVANTVRYDHIYSNSCNAIVADTRLFEYGQWLALLNQIIGNIETSAYATPIPKNTPPLNQSDKSTDEIFTLLRQNESLLEGTALEQARTSIDGELLNRTEAASTALNQIPGIEQAVKTGIQQGSARSLFEKILPSNIESTLAEAFLTLTEESQKHADELIKLFNLGDTFDLKQGILSNLLPNTSEPSTKAQAPNSMENFQSGNMVSGATEDTYDSSDIFHTKTSGNLFQIVSRRVGIASKILIGE